MTDFVAWVIVGTGALLGVLLVIFTALLVFSPFAILIWAVLSTL